MECDVASETYSAVEIQSDESSESGPPTPDSGSQLPSATCTSQPYVAVEGGNAANTRNTAFLALVPDANSAGEAVSATDIIRTFPSLAETKSASTLLLRPAVLAAPQKSKQSSHLTACTIRAQRVSSQERAIVAKGEHTYAKCDAELVRCSVDAIERKIAVANRKAEIYLEEAARMRLEFKRTWPFLEMLNEIRRNENLPRICLGTGFRGRKRKAP